MAYVVIARWTARQGQEETVARILRDNALASQAEPGCRQFSVVRQIDEPRSFVLFEVYDDEAAFQAHRDSEHFQKHVVNDAVANDRLESRTFATYEIVA